MIIAGGMGFGRSIGYFGYGFGIGGAGGGASMNYPRFCRRISRR